MIVSETENSLDSGTIAIVAGAMLQLDFVGSANTTSLSLGGSPVANGTWGSSALPADNRDDTYFSGLGMVTVASPKTPTTLALTSGNTPSSSGASVTYTATLAGASPTGTIEFLDRDNLIGTIGLNGSFQAELTPAHCPMAQGGSPRDTRVIWTTDQVPTFSPST